MLLNVLSECGLLPLFCPGGRIAAGELRELAGGAIPQDSCCLLEVRGELILMALQVFAPGRGEQISLLSSSMTIRLYASSPRAAAGFAQVPTQVATAWKVDVGPPLLAMITIQALAPRGWL